jgi:hypothetical protein
VEDHAATPAQLTVPIEVVVVVGEVVLLVVVVGGGVVDVGGGLVPVPIAFLTAMSYRPFAFKTLP